MSTQPLVFEQTFEGLFLRGLKRELTPALRARLRDAGVDFDRPLDPAYPVEVWNRALAAAAAEVYPQLQTEEAYRKLGERFIEGFGETFIGAAMMAVLRTVGFRRAMARMERNFRSGNNYMRMRMEDRGPYAVDVLCDNMHEPPEFIAGVFVGGGRAVGAQGVQVHCERRDGLEVTFHVTWAAGR